MLIRANTSICRWLVQRGLISGDKSDAKDFRARVQHLAALVPPGGAVLECGGVDRPLLPNGIEQATYVGLDVDPQIVNCPIYDRVICGSVTETIPGQYDLIFSRYLLEHVQDNATSVQCMAACLKPGGIMLHQLPCRNHPYAIFTRMIGNRMQRRLIRWLGRDLHISGYPVFYDHCTPKQFERLLEKQNLTVVNRQAYWAATTYFTAFVPAWLAVKGFNRVAGSLGVTTVASSFIIEAQKPTSTD